MIKVKHITNISLLITGLLSLFICIFNVSPSKSNYNFLFIEPLVWLVVFCVFFLPLIKMGKYSITLYCNIFYSWVIFVVSPALLTIDTNFIGNQHINDAIILSVFSFVFTNILFFIYLLIKKAPIKSDKKEYEILSGNSYVYIVFILLSILLYFIYGREFDLIRFIFIRGTNRFEDITSTFLVLIRTVITGGIVFAFLLVLRFCYIKYNKTGKIFFYFLALLFGLINICIIVGQRRSNQIYTCFIVILLLYNLFPKHKRNSIILPIVVASFVLIFMSIYKHFNVAGYGSYALAIQSRSIDIDFITSTINSYFYGADEITRVFSFCKENNLQFSNCIYDFVRTTFGLSFLVKGKSYTTTELYNLYIYSGMQTNGHTLSSFMYGYIYGGLLLSPLFTLINLIISVNLEKVFASSKYYDVKYIFGLCMIRFATNIYANTPALWSYVTNTLCTLGLVCLFARLFRKRGLKNG